MPKETWTIASILTISLLIALLGFSSCQRKTEVEQARAETAAAQAAIAKREAELSKIQSEAAELKQKLLESQGRIEDLAKEKDNVVSSHRSLEDEMRAALESKDVTISQLQGKLTVNILDRVLFDSGEADLKPDGAGVLRKVAAVLSQHPTIKVHVIGHTDNVPIRAGARSRFQNNWELSTGRALAAVRFLTEKAGVDPRRLGAVGYGEFRPMADNATVEGRARNRRIAITILSEELAGSDAPGSAAAGLSNASAPIGPGMALQTNAPVLPQPIAAPAGPNHPPQD